MSPPSVEPRAEDFPHRIVETMRFADTDRNGHITSSTFAICCQSGRLALLSDPARAVTPPSSQFVLARLVLDYRREMHWPGRRRGRYAGRAYRSIVHHPRSPVRGDGAIGCSSHECDITAIAANSARIGRESAAVCPRESKSRHIIGLAIHVLRQCSQPAPERPSRPRISFALAERCLGPARAPSAAGQSMPDHPRPPEPPPKPLRRSARTIPRCSASENPHCRDRRRPCRRASSPALVARHRARPYRPPRVGD